MRLRFVLTGLALALLADAAACQAAAAPVPAYPAAPRGDVVDLLHGARVPDPYRWLEDLDAPATRAWVEAEAALGRRALDALPGRERIRERLTTLWNFERWSAPVHRGARWFYEHNDGLQNQNVLMVAKGDPQQAPRVLLDPNTLSADGTVALKEKDVTADGRLLVYGLSDAGSDWETLHVRDVATATDLPDLIRWAKFTTPRWTHDGAGFFYTGYDPPEGGDPLKSVNEYHKLYFHRLGTAQAEDRLVYTRRDAVDWFIEAAVSEDGRYLVVSAEKGTEAANTLLYQDLSRPGSPLLTLVGEPRARFEFVGNRGAEFFVRTDQDAPRHRIVAIDLHHPDPAHWRTVVPEAAQTLEGADLIGGQIVARYLEDAHAVVRRFTPAGRALGAVALPGLGSASGFAGRAGDRAAYFRFDGYTAPPSVYRVDLDTGRTRLWRGARLQGFDPADFETRQEFATSRDGTRVPVFIVARKGTPRDGRQPAVLYGYGGFNIAETPYFSPRVAAWIAMGGVFADAVLRGGGEYGRSWHEAGMKTRKQNVFDDFIAAARYLEDERWTDARHLAILGGSNGGLLVAAAEEQAPELFAAAVPMVGVLDMLRFREFTIGRAWESDYGSVDQAEDFAALLAYSPYHNVRAGVDYPATLVVTADHDDRVFPAHSFKFAAALQHADPGGRPLLMRLESRAGHGAGMPTSKKIEEFVDIYAFMLDAFAAAERR